MVDVVDNKPASRFEATVDDHVAELVYERDGDRLVLVHTGVPAELEGQGLGGQLVLAAVDAAAVDGSMIVPRCPFARRWLERHPDEAARVRVDFP